MRGRLEGLTGDRRLRRAADALLALALAGAALVDLTTAADPHAHWGGRGPLELALALAATLPLVVRARFPLAVVLAEVLVLAVLDARTSAHPAFEPFAAVVVAVYSLGAHAVGRRALLGVGLLLGVAAAAVAVSAATDHAPGGLLSPMFWVAAAWVVGRIIQGRRRRTQELEALTRELEAQRDLQAQAAVAVERGRIARELHDIVAHNVSMIVVQAGAAARVLAGGQADVHAALTAIADTGRATIDEMRTLLGVLRAGDDDLALSPQPGLADLEQLLGNVREAGLPVDLRVEGDPAPLPQGVDLSAYRIVQEALTNVLKHAGPARATVTIRYGGGLVELEIRDSGAGGHEGGGAGHGLVGLRERVAMFGGDFDASRRDGGFTVRARLPLAAAVPA